MSKKSNHIAEQSTKAARPGKTGKTRGFSDRSMMLVLVLLAFLLYANTLGHGYVLDDYLIFISPSSVKNGLPGIVEIFTHPYRDQCLGGCLYRPLTLTIFNLEWMVAPNSPFLGHLMNLFWYSATGVLLFFTTKKLMPDRTLWIPFIACLFFIIHPVHTEVIANIKSRDEILSLFFIVLSLHQYARWFASYQWKSLFFAGLSFLAALLSKEGAMTSLAVFPLVGWIFFQKSFASSLKSSGWILIPAGLYLLLRAYALHNLSAPSISVFDNPLVEAHGTERLGTAFLILLRYLGLLIFPLPLISDYSYHAIPLQPLGGISSLAGIIIYGGLAVYAAISLMKRQMAGFFVFAFLTSIALYSQVFLLIGTFIGERLLYLPSLWFILGVCTMVSVVPGLDKKSFLHSGQWKNSSFLSRMLMFGIAGILLWFSFQTIVRNRDWISDYVLMKADVEKSPYSIRLNEGYAEEIYRSISKENLTPDEIKRRLDLSEQYSKRAIAIKPGTAAYSNLANICIQRKDYSQALSFYKKVREISPDTLVANQNIVKMLIFWSKEESDKNNLTLALDLLKQALEYNIQEAEIWDGIGTNYFKIGNFSDARTALEKAYLLAPGNAGIKADLSAFYVSQGLNEEADALK